MRSHGLMRAISRMNCVFGDKPGRLVMDYLSVAQESDDEINHAIRQIISRAVASDEVMDIFAVAGLKKPDISILSDEFLAEVRGLPHKNLAVETLRKLLNNEIKIRSRKFLIQSRSFAELPEASIRKYQNRAIETAAVLEELIALAKRCAKPRSVAPGWGLIDDEVAFYDAPRSERQRRESAGRRKPSFHRP